IALPRHFPISQEIWRPITKWQPDRLAPQGYILGKYHVLDEEYRENKTVEFPITREQAVAEYTQTLRDAVDAAPDGALLLYIQDLELMDFGEEALDILGEAWSTVRGEGRANINFVTPDQYIDAISGRQLPHMRFHQVSWAPEIRLVLRSDGHYPPLHAGPHEGIDNDVEVFRRWPFIFWEPGRFIADTFRSLVRSFGHPIEIGLTGAELDERGYALRDDLSDDQRIAIHLRAMQRACNYGWQPDEDRNKWPYMHGVAIAEILREELKHDEVAARVSQSFTPLPDRALQGLDRVLEIFIDTRVAYLRRGIANLGERAGNEAKRAASEAHLRDAERRRQRASALARSLRAENTKLVASCPIDARTIQRVLALLQEHCREAFLAINEIQRAWMEIEDTAGMIEQMYEYLYDVYPPKFPQILRDMLSEEELAAVDNPALG
ncbi:MAG TPA: glycoside hydrolase, partial [Dehalococcoidia bacterium]